MVQLYEDAESQFQDSSQCGPITGFPTDYNPAKTDVQYQKLIAKYCSVFPATGRLERERGALYGVSKAKGDMKKVRTGITLTCNKHNDGSTKSFRELRAIHRARMLSTSLEALEAKEINADQTQGTDNLC